MTPREISVAAYEAERNAQPTPSDRALLAMRRLLTEFLDATDTGCPESMKAMSIDQVRLLNQLHIAVGL